MRVRVKTVVLTMAGYMGALGVGYVYALNLGHDNK
jgi:hypothetical protein